MWVFLLYERMYFRIFTLKWEFMGLPYSKILSIFSSNLFIVNTCCVMIVIITYF